MPRFLGKLGMIGGGGRAVARSPLFVGLGNVGRPFIRYDAANPGSPHGAIPTGEDGCDREGQHEVDRTGE